MTKVQILFDSAIVSAIFPQKNPQLPSSPTHKEEKKNRGNGSRTTPSIPFSFRREERPLTPWMVPLAGERKGSRVKYFPLLPRMPLHFHLRNKKVLGGKTTTFQPEKITPTGKKKLAPLFYKDEASLFIFLFGPYRSKTSRGTNDASCAGAKL